MSIASAPDWFARYKVDGKIYEVPLACWCLTDRNKIEGMVVEGDNGLMPARKLPGNFGGYFHKSELKKRRA